MDHSPLPWAVDPEDCCRIFSSTPSKFPEFGHSEKVLEDAGWDAASANMQDVAFIVRAVNAYYPMLEALEAVKANQDSYNHLSFAECVDGASMEKVESAIKLAKEGQ